MDNPIPQPPDDVLVSLNRSATVARLLSSAVHEVNNALQVISGTVEILESRKPTDESLIRALERLRTQSARAAGALADVLVFTKAPIEESAAVNLRDTTAHSVSLRMFSIKRSGLALRLVADDATAFVVRGNRGQLQQAVLNLLVNAEQALAGSRGATIVVELTADPQWVTVRVSDEGGGVQIQPRERAFDLFVSTREHHEGAGLGLWAARHIAQRHGGALTLENTAHGATFALKIPRLNLR